MSNWRGTQTVIVQPQQGQSGHPQIQAPSYPAVQPVQQLVQAEQIQRLSTGQLLIVTQPPTEPHKNGCVVPVVIVLILGVLFVIAMSVPDIAAKVDIVPIGQGGQQEFGGGGGAVVDVPVVDESNEFAYQQTPSITVGDYRAILSEAGSPAAPEAESMYQVLVDAGIDPALQLAHARKETSFGLAGVGRNKNLHGVKCNGWDVAYGASCAADGHSIYPSYAASVEAWVALMTGQGLYIDAGKATPRDVLPVYCPYGDGCNPDAYADQMEQWIREWRGRGGQSNTKPHGNPLRAANTVMTQDYGVGTHAPAATWGAIDLAVDGNGDGAADPGASQGLPIHATHDGTVKTTPNSYPGGNFVWVENGEWRTGYAHLDSFAVENGQQVHTGDQIGTMGSTGLSSGPHLDYSVWHRQGGQWVNQNPLDFGALETDIAQGE